MTYAEEIKPLLVSGIRSGTIRSLTLMPEAAGWLRDHPNTTCPACGGNGCVLFQPMQHLIMQAICPRCFGSGEIQYVSAN